jgi:hypothetical protein
MKNAQYHKEECQISGYLKFKTKVKITFGLIQGIITNRDQFSRVGMDLFYRRQAYLLNAIDFAAIAYKRIFCRIVIISSSELLQEYNWRV